MNKVVKLFVVAFVVLLISTIFFTSVAVAENSWESKAFIPTCRVTCGSVAASNGMIYTIGGTTISKDPVISGLYGFEVYPNILTGATEEYNPVTDTWIEKASMPTPREGFGIAAYQNKIYVIGGVVDNSETVTGVNEVYDIETDTWETKTSMPTSRGSICANVVNGKIYVIGGHKLNPTRTGYLVPNVNEVYDVVTDTWSSKNPPPVNVENYASAIIDDKIYLIRYDFLTPDVGDKSTLIYDTETDLWSFGAPIPTPVCGDAVGATSGKMTPKRLYVIGGGSDANMVQIYDPKTDTWTTGVPMPTRRLYSSVAVLDDRLYVIGGTGPDTVGIANELYTPAGYKTSITRGVDEVGTEKSTLSELSRYKTSNLPVGTILIIVAVVIVIVGIVTVALRTTKRRI